MKEFEYVMFSKAGKMCTINPLCGWVNQDKWLYVLEKNGKFLSGKVWLTRRMCGQKHATISMRYFETKCKTFSPAPCTTAARARQIKYTALCCNLSSAQLLMLIMTDRGASDNSRKQHPLNRLQHLWHRDQALRVWLGPDTSIQWHTTFGAGKPRRLISVSGYQSHSVVSSAMQAERCRIQVRFTM